jgi:hypothetical protein
LLPSSLLQACTCVQQQARCPIETDPTVTRDIGRRFKSRSARSLLRLPVPGPSPRGGERGQSLDCPVASTRGNRWHLLERADRLAVVALRSRSSGSQLSVEARLSVARHRFPS